MSDDDAADAAEAAAKAAALFGRNVRLLRESKGMSQTDLAARIRKSKSYLSHIEAGRRTASDPVRRALARVLRVDVDQLSASGPEAGHTFRISMSSRGSYSVVGEPGHRDAAEFDEPRTVEVRAWNLREALLQAIDLPLSAWFPEED